MTKLFKFSLFTILFLMIVFLVFYYLYIPQAILSLEQENLEFRALKQDLHQQIDSQYEHKYLSAAGVNWHYVETGNPNGELILLLHGLPESWYSWHKVMPLLNQNYRIIALDMKGYGRTSSEDKNYDWHFVAKQSLAFVDELGVDKFHLVGHDWGAIVASIMAGDFPDRLMSFVRMQADIFTPKTLTKYLEKPQFLIFSNPRLAQYLMTDAQWFIDLCYVKTNMLFNKMSADNKDYFTYEFSRPGVAEAVSLYFKSENHDMYALLEKIAYNDFRFPVLQLQGEGDPTMPVKSFSSIPKLCKNVELVWLKNASHFSTLDQPEQVAQAINNFLYKHGNTSI